MNNSLHKQLVNFGLSDKEAKIYLTLLELGMATVFETAKQSGINRSSAYVVLESLKKKGLVGISDDKKVRNYIAANPDTLFFAAKENARKHDSIKSNIESIIPELKTLYKGSKHRPVVKMFEGENGAREVYLDLFSTQAKDLKTIANPLSIFKRVPDFIQNQDAERGRRGIKMYAINPATKEMIKLYKNISPNKPYEQAIIPENKFIFSSDMGIYGDKVSFVSPKDNYGIIIENKDIANLLRTCFDLAWEESKRLNKLIKIKNNLAS